MIMKFRILSFWQVGTGSGTMGTFDSRTARDPDGLPIIPGRQVKGLCRHAVHEAEAFGFTEVPAGTTDQLFGTRLGSPSAFSEPVRARLGEDDPRPGLLRFSDARLPEATRSALIGNEKRIAGLFSSVRSTAMTEKGTARPHSLRFDEVVIPLDLEAEVSPLSDQAVGWLQALRTSLPLLNTIGSGRTRGLGRVIVTLER